MNAKDANGAVLARRNSVRDETRYSAMEDRIGTLQSMSRMSTLDRTLRFLLSESRNSRTRHLLDHIQHFESSERLQLLRQLLCIRSPASPLPVEISEDIESLLVKQREHRLLTPGASIPILALLERPGRQPANIRLWKGDITNLTDVTAITNAANSQMLGCFQPSHKCIDNVIHSWAGPRLRQECYELMDSGRRELPVGDAVSTRGYCLPSPFVVHTVGPQLERGASPTDTERQQLRQCYVSVLEETERLPAAIDGTKRIALCGISTGLFAFPVAEAAQIAVHTVQAWLLHHEDSTITDVIFVTYTDTDHEVYSSLLKTPAPGWKPSALGSLIPAITSVEGAALTLAHEWLQEADAVIVTAGAGLSAADGLDYTSSTLFKQRFPTFLGYGFNRLYDVFGFYDWPSEQERWSYFFTHLEMIRLWPQSDLYKQLIAWLETYKDDAHVRTSNADGLFLANGWREEQLSTPQGQYAVLQCMANCRPDSYWPSLPYLEQAQATMDPIKQRLKDTSAIPVCRNCGGDMFICVRAADWFNDRPYREGEVRWREFRRRTLTGQKKTVILELGVGMNTPGVLRWANEDLVRKGGGKVRLIRVGLDIHASVPHDIEEKGWATYIDGDIGKALPYLVDCAKNSVR